MKLISLNLWGGRIYNPLEQFLNHKKRETDIFCFQEMYHQADGKLSSIEWAYNDIEHNLYEKVGHILDTHVGYFYPHFEDFWGLAIYIKKGIELFKEGEEFVHYEPSIIEARKGKTSKNIQYITIKHNKEKINIINFHGLWNGNGKTDSESRMAQSEKITTFLKNLEGEIILCGDFNLRPDTKSLKMIENFGFRNLIKDYNISSTRTSLYKKEERFADYMMVTKDIEVKNFEVLPDEVSDHNAMFLDFNIS